MTVLDTVGSFIIGQKRRPVCDDCIASNLGHQHRQHANKKTNWLALDETKFDRRQGICSICGSVKKVIRAK